MDADRIVGSCKSPLTLPVTTSLVLDDKGRGPMSHPHRRTKSIDLGLDNACWRQCEADRGESADRKHETLSRARSKFPHLRGIPVRAGTVLVVCS